MAVLLLRQVAGMAEALHRLILIVPPAVALLISVLAVQH